MQNKSGMHLLNKKVFQAAVAPDKLLGYSRARCTFGPVHVQLFGRYLCSYIRTFDCMKAACKVPMRQCTFQSAPKEPPNGSLCCPWPRLFYIMAGVRHQEGSIVYRSQFQRFHICHQIAELARTSRWAQPLGLECLTMQALLQLQYKLLIFGTLQWSAS